MTSMPKETPNYTTAEDLRKKHQYAEAAGQFAVIWERNPNAYIGWRYAQCLRKIERVEEAEKVARIALEKYPDDAFTKKELGWVLYDKEIKPAKEASDLGRAVHFAKEILALNSDMFAVRLLVQAVMKLAKDRGKWDIVLEWACRVEATDLSNEPIMFDGKSGMSDRETWYVNKARGLFELGRHDESRSVAMQGLTEFPEDPFLARTAALALAKNGDLKGGAEELSKLLKHKRLGWYVKADLAELEYSIGNRVEAYRLMCEAISNSQEDEFKLGCFVTLGQIALTLDKLDVAATHVALAKAVRKANNWSIPANLIQLEKEVRAKYTAKDRAWPALPQETEQLSRICHQYWKEGATDGLEFIRGSLSTIDPAKGYTFIQRDDGGEKVFVLMKDVPRRCAYEGARIEFTLKNSFDKKKNRE
ncbi:MAG: hypothetical protein J2P31_02640, partial [Blastocatellia bacterium]|nr:hypothetical protein [Blastocatellia bacterium]